MQGASGGPREDCVTGLLVRSIAQKWSKRSLVAVDAGTMLAGIARALDNCTTVDLNQKGRAIEVTEGPFAGLVLPNRSSIANATYTVQELIDTILVTHPHLDHTSALALNSPAAKFQHGRFTIAGLPSVIAALKNHMFNGIMWPNLSDEDGGVGLVTYRRLTDGGNVMLGSGGGMGYTQVCDGLVVKCMSVAHGESGHLFHEDTGRHHRLESGVFTPEYFARFPRPQLTPLPRQSVSTTPQQMAQEQRRASTAPGQTRAGLDPSFFSLLFVFVFVHPVFLELNPLTDFAVKFPNLSLSQGSRLHGRRRWRAALFFSVMWRPRRRSSSLVTLNPTGSLTRAATGKCGRLLHRKYWLGSSVLYLSSVPLQIQLQITFYLATLLLDT